MNQSREEGPVNPAGHRSWRGQAALDTPVARHRWQRDWTALPAQRGRFRQHWQRLRMLVLFIAFGGLLALLSYLLLQSPIQTPVIAIAATQYDAPWPINVYGAEDLQRLATLNRKSLRLVDATAQWSSRDRALDSLRRHLEHLDQASANASALIVYISAIGAVDDAGQPCLILPGAAVLDANTWLPVNDVLQAIQTTAGEQRQALVVLDCVRDTTLPAAGIVRNEFVEGLDDLLQKTDTTRLAILVANQTGDRAWSSANLGQTVFGYYFHRGLAGEADYVTSGGDGNRRVTVKELQHYLLTHVDAWAQQQRGARQRPQLIPGSGNFEVAWVIHNGHTRSTPLAATISSEQLDALWRLRDGLTSAQLDRVDPKAWQDLQHQLMRVAEMSQAGEAYALPAR
ncbi:MAG TPA: hypothetical protein VL096_06670, partial [Pirellulaceae bacterium]|nr:hypothetical protein [Pirellulaceae bacterium]